MEIEGDEEAVSERRCSKVMTRSGTLIPIFKLSVIT